MKRGSGWENGGVPGQLAVLFGAVFTIAVCWAAGGMLFHRLGVKWGRVEGAALSGVVGAALVSFGVFVLCLLHFAYAGVFASLGLAVLAVRMWLSVSAVEEEWVPQSWRWRVLFGVVFGAYALLYLSVALSPEHSPDGQAYHLGLVYRFLREHGMGPVTTTLYAAMPLATEMLFLFAFAFGKHAAAATVHCASLFALVALMVCYGRRIGRYGVGWTAAALVFLSPIVGADAASAYNDVALATSGFAMFYLLEVWREDSDSDRRRALLLPIGLLAGFCFAIKYTGFVAALYAGLVIAGKRKPRALLAMATPAVVLALPWLVKNWLWLGNPVAPLMNRWFENPYFHVSFEEAFRANFRHYTLTSLWQLPWAATVTGEVGGQLGAVFLLAPMGLLAVRSVVGRYCLFAMVVFALPYPQNIGSRFLIPVLPFVALSMALAFGRSRRLQGVLVLAAAVLAWPKVTQRLEKPGNMRISQFEWKSALGMTSPDEFLRTREVEWRIARMIDAHLPRGKRMWSSQPIAQAYTDADVLVSYLSAEGDQIHDIISNAASPEHDREPTWNLRFLFAPLALRHLRVVQHTASPTDTWTIGEMYVFRGAAEIRPKPGWRVDAAPFPWDIPLAFDRNPATRWSSWRATEAGMHVDVVFDRPEMVDRVELHCSHDQWKVALTVESCNEDVCRPISSKMEQGDLPGLGDFRRDAIRAVRAHGVEYLLIDDGYLNAADLGGNAALWGLEFVAEGDHRRLYRIL